MSVSVRLCVPLQRFCNNKEVVYHEAGSLKDIIQGLESKHPGIAEVILSGDRIKDHFIVSVNDKIIDDKDGINTVLKDGDEVSIMPLVIGG
ncbi:MAG: MoaD/ThiS family protein [Thermodesulfovibrionales bacterium]|nr:MoaD/ThiS family protein [Thermodesulfovibrionales bacterium]